MKVYTFGNKNNPAIMLLPGTCCHWNGNFGKVIPLLYPFVHYGKFKLKLLQKRLERRKKEMPEYVGEFMKSFGEARQYVTKRSCKNQFYSDIVTPLPDKINPKGTEIHIFYALKMGEKYRARYMRHFAKPIIHEQNLQHEELLVRYPEKWAELVKSIITNNKGTCA